MLGHPPQGYSYTFERCIAKVLATEVSWQIRKAIDVVLFGTHPFSNLIVLWNFWMAKEYWYCAVSSIFLFLPFLVLAIMFEFYDEARHRFCAVFRMRPHVFSFALLNVHSFSHMVNVFP